jgi:hypothetical protein
MRDERLRRTGTTASVPAFAALALLVTFISVPRAEALTDCTSPPPVFPITDLQPGMTATGLTTIEGSTPTTFDVEILGVMPDYIWLGTDAIVVRLTGPQSFLDAVGGAFAGMSGSPVSIGGKLVGAVSYGVSFDPTIVGLTPAQNMVDLLGWSAPSAAALPARIPFDRRTRRAVASALDVPASTITTGLERLPTRLGVSGLGGPMLARFARRVTRHDPDLAVAPAAGMPAGLPVVDASFAAGQPIGSVLSWGDFTVWAAGTVTLTCQDELVAYGHSLFYDPPGAISIGLTGVNVLAVGNGMGLWAGDMVPVLTEPRGTFVQDRFTGQVGVVGQAPPSMPITSSVSSPDTGLSRVGRTDALMQEDYWGEEELWGHLVLNLGAVEQEIASGTVSYGYTISGTRQSGVPFTVRNRTMSYSEYGAAYDVRKIVDAYDALTSNRWEDVTVDAIDVHGAITHDRQEGTIGRVRTSSSLQPRLSTRAVLRARPGSTIHVEITIEPVEGGAPVVETVSLRVPQSRRGELSVTVGGGRDRWQNQREASSLDELLAILNGGQHDNDLVVSGLGRTISKRQPLIVRENADFTVRVVR